MGNNTGKVVVAGDLQVDGTTTTVNSTTVNIVDKNIQVATGSADDTVANGGGITIASGDGNKTFQFEATGDNLGSSENLNLASGKAYKINNTSVLNATTLGSNVVNSSLTSLGTLTSLNVTGDITGAGDFTLTDTDTGSSEGPELKLYRNSASPADADYLGQIKFAGESDTGVERNYAKITGKILDASNGTEDGIIEFAHIKAGSETITGRFRSDSLQLLNGTNLTVDGSATASSFIGPLTGNVTGNLSGTATLATDLAINGANQIVYQDSNNDSDILPTGNAGQILASSGSGAAPQWVDSAPAGAIEGITIRDESSIIGTANSISTINFIGSVVTADAAVGAGIATVTVDAIAGIGISEDSGSKATGAIGLDFVGPIVSVDAASNTGISTVRVEGLSIKDEGSSVGTAGSITTLNFVGSGIAAAVSGDTATITAAGGGATTDDVVALAIALG